jgi:hypothetical protein
MSYADISPSILWRKQQTEARLVLRSKPRNCRDDFEAQTEKPEATGFEAKPGEAVATDFEAKLQKTIATGFEVKLEKTAPVVSMLNY